MGFKKKRELKTILRFLVMVHRLGYFVLFKFL